MKNRRRRRAARIIGGRPVCTARDASGAAHGGRRGRRDGTEARPDASAMDLMDMGIGLDANNLVSPTTQTRSASGSRLARMLTLTRCLARIVILTPGERNHGGRQCDQGRHAPCGAPPRTLVPQTLSPPHALTPLAGRLSLCGVDGGSQGDQVVEVDGVDLRQGRASFLESLDQARSLSSACVLASPLPPRSQTVARSARSVPACNWTLMIFAAALSSLRRACACSTFPRRGGGRAVESSEWA